MPVALITGASRGFGRATALALAEEGWSLVVDARTSYDLDLTTHQLRTAGATSVIAVAGDVADQAHRGRLADAVTSLGSLDVLINNASVLGPSPQPTLSAYPIPVLKEVYAVNTFAPLALTQALLPQLRASRGRVVNISSDAAVEAYEGWGGYGSSKAALEQWSRVLAAEEPDLRVYVFDPGDMRTRMHQAAFPGEDISDRPEPETVVPALQKLLASELPSGRYSSATLLAEVGTGAPA
jgi:NAD(P)-dependent dehydrogenase (short-subunit alcohol dehydrogenase family)